MTTTTTQSPRRDDDVQAAVASVINAAESLCDDTAEGDSDAPQVPRSAWKHLSDALDALDMLIPDSEQPYRLGVAARLISTPRDDVRETCTAAPDHADISATIDDAATDWQAKGYTSALAEVRDMANVGRALMEALPEGYHYLNCPSEIVSDLQNERFEALARTGDAA